MKMMNVFRRIFPKICGRKTKLHVYAVRRGPYYSLYRICGRKIIDGVCVEDYQSHVGLISNKLFPETEVDAIIKFTIETDSKTVGIENVNVYYNTNELYETEEHSNRDPYQTKG